MELIPFALMVAGGVAVLLWGLVLDRKPEPPEHQTVVGFDSPEVWACLEALPGFNEQMAQATASLDAGLRVEFVPDEPESETKA